MTNYPIYISRFYPYEHGIQEGFSRFEVIQASQGRDSHHQEVIVQAPLKAVFHRGAIPFAAQQQAQAVFDSAFGSANGEPPGPYRKMGVASDPDFQGFMYDASEQPLFYSQFNINTDCPTNVPGMTDEEVRAKFEEVLSNSNDLRSQDMIRVAQPRLAEPWAGYDEISTGPGHSREWVANQVVEIGNRIGIDFTYVTAYERENENRDEVLAKVALEMEKRAQARAEIEALSA